METNEIDDIPRRIAYGWLKAYLEGKQNLKWVLFPLHDKDIQGQVLTGILEELKGYGDQQRWKEVYDECQLRGWLD